MLLALPGAPITKTNNPKRSLFLARDKWWGLGLSKWNVCPGEGDLEGLPACAPQDSPGLPACLPPCQKMKERRTSLLNAPWEPSAGGLVTRPGQYWQDASYACRRREGSDPRPAPSLKQLPPAPGLYRAAREVETETGHGRWDPQPISSPSLNLCAP